MTQFHIIIPARYGSSRLPGKVLMTIGNKTILQSVYEQATEAGALSVTIATDDEQVYSVASQFASDVMMTSATHASGTDRLSEVVQKKGFSDDVCIVNVQGDEPLIEPILIKQVADNLMLEKTDMATLCWPIESQEQLLNPNVVKVVYDKQHRAIYFSRQMIPHQSHIQENLTGYYRHIGLYAYRADFLRAWAKTSPCWIEQQEKLEQLRALWHGHQIHVDLAKVLPKQDINCAEDLAHIRKLMQAKDGVISEQNAQ